MMPQLELSVTRPGHSPSLDIVAEEVPVAFEYNGIAHTVMLSTPADLKDFALGFSLSEGIVAQPGEVFDVEIEEELTGITLHLEIAGSAFAKLKQRRRSLAGRTGCGLCGTESLQQVQRHPDKVPSGQYFSPEAVHVALSRLPQMQALQTITGAVHAAAWARDDGAIIHIEEDIGRHNALDKLIGTLAMMGEIFADGFVIVTSRASYEMVQKSAAVGIPMLVAVSAPTSLAIDLAQETGLTLAGFARGGGHVVYTHSQRL
jgi:FdhD protein